MEAIITKSQVAQAVYNAIPQLACVLPPDIVEGLETARASEANARGRAVLDHLVENARIAKADCVPLCQDTGTVWVSLEVGPDVLVAGDVFANVDAMVARAYDEARLRKSVVCDAVFDRTNTQNNTPAFCDIHPVEEQGVARLHIMLKGGGSDNASRVVMLTPGAGRAAIVAELVACVREKAANACPPLVIGVGIGSTFDKVAGLAKRALMRPVNEDVQDLQVRELEEELLTAVNATGLGPGSLGGACTALAVRVATAPCHIAALPLAINMGCSAMRRVTVPLACGLPLACQPTEALDAAASPCTQSSCATAGSRTEVRVACTIPRILDTGETLADVGGPVSQGEPVSQGGLVSQGEPASQGGPVGQSASNIGGPVSQTPARPLAEAACAAGIADAGSVPTRLTLPLAREELSQLKAGDACLLSGPLFTLRDAGHMRLLDELREQGNLPYELSGHTIFYAGPTPSAAGRPFGAVGPTTASRMDFATPALHRVGIVATIGKGQRSREVQEACVETGSVYFIATGGAAAYLAQCVVSSEVVAYEELGTEALRRIEVIDFPVFVGVDTRGCSLYDLV